MKRTITTTIITLSLLLSLALWSVGRGVHAKITAPPVMTSSQLDPANFASLGASPFTTDGTYTINASKDLPNPILLGTDGTTTIATGIFYSPSGGTVARDEIAIFTFNSINIPAAVMIVHAGNGNSRPVALLAHGNITIDGTVNVSGGSGVGSNGGNAGPGGGGGGGTYTASSGGLGFVNGSVGGGNTLIGLFGGNGGSVVVGGGGSGGTNRSGGGGAFGGNGGSFYVGVGGGRRTVTLR